MASRTRKPAAVSTKRSAKALRRAQTQFPGGVNSPVRAFGNVGGTPRFIARARGAYLTDIDRNMLVDYVGSWGPMILGHADPRVVKALREAAGRGTSYGAPTEAESELARIIQSFFPSLEMMRFTSSGTEAAMGALRAARGFTGRDKIIKFEGCYHGHADYLLVKAGSGALTFGVPDSAGIPAAMAGLTLTARYNDAAHVEELLKANAGEVAAVIVEPVAGNMGCVPPVPGFLESLRTLSRKHGALLVFDEVMTGFRVSAGGAQELYGIRPDLTCLGKIVGGGMPLGVYGGRREIMEKIAPLGPVYQAGTLSGNPMAVAAGIATLKQLRPSLYKRIDNYGERLEHGYRELLARHRLTAAFNRVGSMFTLFLGVGKVNSFETAARNDRDQFRRYFHRMLELGIYLPPSPFEAAFVSAAHGSREYQRTIRAADDALGLLNGA